MVEVKHKRKNASKNRRVTKDGNVYYYYRKKKKPGPKKKRGPKKKKKTSWVRRVFAPWLFKIIVCTNKNQVSTVGRFHDESEVMMKKDELLRLNREVICPKERVNNCSNNRSVTDLTMEYLILKQNNDNDDTIIKLPNKYGKMVNHISSNEKWIIWDKFPCLIEETFWVYGYDKSKDRKTITWIYENLIEPYLLDRYNILRFIVYGNKFIIEHDNKNIELVICKNVSDSIRVYNLLKNSFCDKFKNALFLGLVNNSESRKKYINLIQNKTKWSLKDIYRKSTRH